ncbi:hypothetical protein MOP88_08635 [Sphingomonas sp. WKB10]|nr:hypothetical protein [Sphingomonas sp. WKB10]
MLVAILLVLTLGYQALILWRGQLMAGWRIGFAARHLRWASGLWLGYGLPALLGLAAIGDWGRSAACRLPSCRWRRRSVCRRGRLHR